jgi:uncharacterized RDD family membrane protein YckC
MGFERQGFSDYLNIDTPEQVELRYSVAGIGSRFVALLIDHLIIFAVLFVEILLLVWVSKSAPAVDEALDTGSKWAIAILIFLNFAFIWGYFALFETYWRGQTPGKRVMKLRVIKDAGRQITFFEALARNLLRFVDYLPGAYLTGFITMVCNKSNKRLGDFVAGTIVVHERLDDQPLLVSPATMFPSPTSTVTPLEPWRTSLPAMFPGDAIAKLSLQDLVVIEAFFARALELSLETRATMAERIARQMVAKMGVPLPEGNPERAIESIGYAMRQGTGIVLGGSRRSL